MAASELAMAPPPWTITSKKRKSSPTVVFSGRKRQRRDETPSTARARQQTLTQAQWVDRSSSTVEDLDMSPIGAAKKPTKVESRKKRESTLTQMDFFAKTVPMDLDSEEMAMLSEDTSGTKDQPPQLDGTYESPRRPRKRKVMPKLKTESTESQEYQPTQSRTGGELKSTIGTGEPRRSTRQSKGRSKILSDPADNFDYFSQALAGNQTPSAQRTKALEIQDSADDDYVIDLSGSPTRPGLRTPSRPGTAQTVIKSSQSPESLPPSTKQKDRTTREQPNRSPLAQRSANVRQSPRIVEALPELPGGQENVNLVTQSGLKRRKYQAKTSVADSQTNLWSVPPTSSPEQARLTATSHETPTTMAPETRASVSDQYPIEIPSTSQVEQQEGNTGIAHSASTIGHNESFKQPDQSEVQRESRNAPTNTVPGTTTVQPSLAIDETIAGQDSAATTVTEASTRPEPNPKPPPATPRAARRTVIEDTEDEDSEFGSPILNDTQYNEEVKQRTSSPAAPDYHTSSRPTSSHSNPIPTPRLVRHSSPAQQSQYVESDASSDGVSLPPAQPPKAMGNGTITRVPLNDVQPIPTSSQSVLSAKSATQRSVRPASMPHPSQISTQEATQGYLGSFYMPFDTPHGTEQITIKDSSSVRLPMSQIPPQPSQSQLNIDLGVEMLDEDDQYGNDYDLDPPSSAPLQQPPANTAKAALPDEIPTERIVFSSPVSSPKPKKRKLDNDTIDAVSRRSTATAAPSQPQEQLSSPVRPNVMDNANDHPYLEEEPAQLQEPANADDEHDLDLNPAPPSSSASQPASLSTQPVPLARPLHEYTQLPGFNNETQSNFTQDGHVSAAYVHRQREAGLLPKWYTPRPFKVPGYTRR